MNRQDALVKCKAIRDYLTAGNPVWSKEEVAEAMTMAIEALKVDIVRCGECKYRDCCSELGDEVEADDYCSFGERRSDD